MKIRHITFSLFMIMGICFFIPAKAFPVSLYLNIPDGMPNKKVICDFGFQESSNVAAFKLALDFSDKTILSADLSRFVRNSGFFPDLCLSGQTINFVKQESTGRLHFVGLSPIIASGTSKAGDLTFDVSSSAVPNETQQVTLSGEIYTNTGSIVALSPVFATFTVLSFTDQDSDGMDDNWEIKYFRGLSRTGTDDYDFDSLSDKSEYDNNTDPTDNIKAGDVNRDSEVTLSDAVLSIQISANIQTNTTCLYADVNTDEKIGIQETIYILQYITGLK